MSHDITVNTQGERTYHLERAILLYESQGNGSPHSYATLHPVYHGKGGARIGPGSPATREACSQFVRSLADEAAFCGFLSPRMLYVGPRTVAWWRPPAPARVWFAEAALGAKTPARSAITPQPGLIFALVDGVRWHVVAIKGKDRPEPDTQLHVAPYFNVWDSSQICEGNLQRPDAVTPKTLDAFERAFWDSRFTHTNAMRLVQFKGGPVALWKALLGGRYKAFPERALRPMKTTLAQWLKTLEAR